MEEAEITRLLTEYKRVGLAGVEITCLYGVQGNEARNRRYRSPEWIAAAKHTIEEANRLGLGVDLLAGSGWRMGGAEITPEIANRRVVVDVQEVGPGAALLEKRGVVWHAVVGNPSYFLRHANQADRRGRRWHAEGNRNGRGRCDGAKVVLPDGVSELVRHAVMGEGTRWYPLHPHPGPLPPQHYATASGGEVEVR